MSMTRTRVPAMQGRPPANQRTRATLADSGVDSHLDVQGCLETMTTDHQSSPPEARPDDDFRARNARALELLREWLADESGYDAEVLPVLKAELEADRLAHRRRFSA
jgi:hypothetical protein